MHFAKDVGMASPGDPTPDHVATARRLDGMSAEHKGKDFMRALAGSNRLDPEMAEKAEAAMTPLPEDIYAYRQHRPSEGAMVSLTLNPDMATMMYGNNEIERIKVKKGTPVLWMPDEGRFQTEMEVVLPRDYKAKESLVARIKKSVALNSAPLQGAMASPSDNPPDLAYYAVNEWLQNPDDPAINRMAAFSDYADAIEVEFDEAKAAVDASPDDPEALANLRDASLLKRKLEVVLNYPKGQQVSRYGEHAQEVLRGDFDVTKYGPEDAERIKGHLSDSMRTLRDHLWRQNRESNRGPFITDADKARLEGELEKLGKAWKDLDASIPPRHKWLEVYGSPKTEDDVIRHVRNFEEIAFIDGLPNSTDELNDKEWDELNDLVDVDSMKSYASDGQKMMEEFYGLDDNGELKGPAWAQDIHSFYSDVAEQKSIDLDDALALSNSTRM
jgi:hypothetical protein